MLLILLLFNLLPCSIIATSMEDLPPNDFLPGINSLRRKYAKQYNVPNMHELIWSEDLVNILKLLDWSADWPEARKTWRYTALKSYETALSQIETDAINFLKKTPEEIRKTIKDTFYTMDRMELFNPLQRFIGCTPKSDKGEVVIVCSVGTKGSFTLFDTTGQSTSIPGSKCHQRYENKDGLCVANNPGEESYKGRVEYLIDDINQLRKTYANRFNVPNMHQLIWSEDLQNILKPLDWGRKWPEARTTWRFSEIVNTYETVEDSIRKEMYTLSEKNSEQRKSHIDGHRSSNYGVMEFLNPLQRFYACGPIADKKTNSTATVCLVGPQGGLTLFDTTGLSEEIPGSNCHRGYQNNGGICVAMDSANEKFYNPKYFLEDINQIRKDYAQKYSVPNMHQLVWSNEIFQFLDTLEYTNISQQSGKIWRHDLFLGSAYFNALSDFEGMNEPYFKKSTKAMITTFLDTTTSDSSTLDSLELLNPYQKFIQCAPKVIGGSTKMICVIGPSGKAKLFDMDTVSRAKNVVGSQCAAKYTDEDGLCVPEDSSKLSFFGNPTDFVKDVNLMRKTYAHKFNVPNMHQLVWKDSLATIAKSFDESRSSPKARVTWRYVKTVYSGIKEAIELEVEENLVEMNQEHFLEFISNGNSNSSVGLLELLNPLQTHIGCAKKMGPAESYMLCVLGDEGQFKMWNLKKNSVKPGTSCKNGYKNEGGLCTMPTPPPKKKSAAKPQVASAGNQRYQFIDKLHAFFLWSLGLLRFDLLVFVYDEMKI